MTFDERVAGAAVDVTEAERAAILEAYKPTELELFILTHMQEDLSCAPPIFHRSMLHAFEYTDSLIVEAPRHTGKSVLLTKGYTGWEVATQRARCVLITSASEDEAKRRVRIVKEMFETDPVLCANYGIEIGKRWGGKWTDEWCELRVRGKKAEIHARGMTSQIRGIHPDLVIIDDPEEMEGAKSPAVRAAVRDVYFRSILPTRKPKNKAHPRARIMIIGTPINAEVLVHFAYTNWEGRFENFERMRFPILEDGTTTDLTGVEPGQSIFPSMWPLEELEHMRTDMGARAFAAEYLCHPAPDGVQVFFEEFFRVRYRALPEERKLYTIISVDPAKTVTDLRHGCETAIMAGSIERYENDPLMFIRGCKIGHMTPLQRARTAIAMALQFEAEWIFVEDLQKGQSGKEAPSDVVALIEQVAEQQGVAHRFGVRVHNPRGDKAERAARIVPYCEQGRVLWPDNLAGDMYRAMTQLLLFPFAERDDAVDAFSQLLENLNAFSAGVRTPWPDSKRAVVTRAGGLRRESELETSGGWRVTPRSRFLG